MVRVSRRRPPGRRTDEEDRNSGQQRTFLGRSVEGQEVVDATHLRFAAAWAEAVIDALVLEEGVEIRDVGLLGVLQCEQATAERELVFALAVDEEAIVAHAPELRRRDMGEETTDEFIGRKKHGLFNRLFFLSVIQVAEGDLSILDALDAVVGDGDAVDVAPQVADQVPRLGEGSSGDSILISSS